MHLIVYYIKNCGDFHYNYHCLQRKTDKENKASGTEYFYLHWSQRKFFCGDVIDFYSPMVYVSAYSDTVCRHEFRPNSVFSQLQICLFRVWSLIFVLRWIEISKRFVLFCFRGFFFFCVYIYIYIKRLGNAVEVSSRRHQEKSRAAGSKAFISVLSLQTFDN